MAFLENLDLENIELSSFEPVPPGQYVVINRAASLETTTNGNGNYVKIDHEIVEGQYAGRHIFNNINFKNPNPTAVNIGKQRLKELTLALGIHALTDTDQLISDTPIVVDVTVEKTEGYDPQNRVKRYVVDLEKSPAKNAEATKAVAEKAKTSTVPAWANK